MNHYPVTVAVALVIAFLFLAYAKQNWRRWKYAQDLSFPAPITKRKDLKFAFYGCQDNQVAETKGSFNLLMEAQFDGVDKCIQNILDAGTDTLLYVAGQLFDENVPGQKHRVNQYAVPRLQHFFALLQARGALKYVTAICPIDEPNNTVVDAEELRKAISILRMVFLDFPELHNCKLATFYAADKPFMCQELYDWVGFDDYDMKAHVLASNKYHELVMSLRPDQHTMIIVGAAYGHDPVPFVNYAQGAPEVAVVVAFLWCNVRNDDVGALGARSNGMAQQYLAAGRSVVEA